MTQGPTHEHPHHEFHVPIVHLPEALDELGEDLKEDKVLNPNMFAAAIGGWRGVFDSSLPSAAFIVVYLLNGHVLTPAIWVAVGAGVLIAILRIVRRQSLQQIISGLFGVALSAYIASRTDSAVGFFLPAILFNSAYGLAFLFSGIIRWPLIGLIVGASTGDFTGWRKDPALRRACALANWLWVAMYAIKLAIQLPLYFLGLVGPLGVSKIALGYPPMILVGWLSYRMVKGPMSAAKARAQTKVP